VIVRHQNNEYLVNASFNGSSIDEEWSKIAHKWFREETLSLTTSGSTGAPERISLSSSLLLWSAHQTKEALTLHNEDVFHCIPLSKVGGLMLFIRSLIFDWNVTFVEPSGDPMRNLGDQHTHTLISLVPYQLGQILKSEASKHKLSRFKTVLIGGASIPPWMESEITSDVWSDTRFFHSYGMTETASHIAVREVGSSKPGTFTLVDGVKCRVDEYNRLSVEIPAVALSINTNDLVEVHGREITYLGRDDDVVNSGGLKLHLGPLHQRLESVLQQSGAHSEFLLWKMPHDTLGEQLIFIGIQNEQEELIEELVRETLEPIEQPKKFFWIANFEYTASGKPHREKTLSKLIEVGS